MFGGREDWQSLWERYRWKVVYEQIYNVTGPQEQSDHRFDYLSSVALFYLVFTVHKILFLYLGWQVCFKDDLILNIVNKCHKGQTVLGLQIEYLECVFFSRAVVSELLVWSTRIMGWFFFFLFCNCWCAFAFLWDGRWKDFCILCSVPWCSSFQKVSYICLESLPLNGSKLMKMDTVVLSNYLTFQKDIFS